MQNAIFQKIIYSSVGLAAFCLLTPAAMAIGIRPMRYEIVIAPGGSASGEVIVVNETDKDFEAEPVLKVFNKNNDEGFPVYLSKDQLEEQNKIEDFLSWIEISDKPISVPAKSEVAVSYTVHVPKDAKPGGRYATIAYQPVLDASEGILVNVRAASLLYVTVGNEGDIIRAGKLDSFGLREEPTSGKALTFYVTFSNTGNTHLRPVGWIEVTNLDTGSQFKEIAKYVDPKTGQIVASDAVPVNLNKSCVLPGSSRTFKAEWKNDLKPGRYLADLTLTYAENTKPIVQSYSFETENHFTAEPQIIRNGAWESDKIIVYSGVALVLLILIAFRLFTRNKKGERSKKRK